MSKNFLSRAFVTGSLLYTGLVHGVEVRMTAGYTAEYSTNVERATTNERSDLIHRPSISFGVSESTSSLNADLNYQAYRRTDRENLFADKNIVRGQGSLSWNTWRNRLTASVQNQRVETVIDERRANRVDNKEVSDRSSAMLSVIPLQLGRQYLQLSGTYSEITTNSRDADTQAEVLEAQYFIPTGKIGTFSFFFRNSKNSYDLADSNDYKLVTKGAQFTRENARLSFDGYYGRSRAELQKSDGEVDADTWSASALYALSEDSSISLSVSRDLSDNELQDVTIDEPDRNRDFESESVVDSALNELFIIKSRKLSWSAKFSGIQSVLQLAETKIDYQFTSRDLEREGIRLSLQRGLTPRLTGRFAVRRSEVDFFDGTESHRELSFRLGVDYEISRRLSAGFSAVRYDRDSDVNGEISDTSYLMSITYDILKPPK